MNSFFVLSFEDKNDWKGYKTYILPKVKIKDYNVYDWWKKLFWSAYKKNDEMTYDNIRKIANGQGDDYTTCCLLY